MSKLTIASFLFLSAVLAAIGPRNASGFAILHVDDDQTSPSTADGTTWPKAYKDLRLAIQKATTQPATYPEIRVATPPTPRDSYHFSCALRPSA
jgi:hypothetical protein